MDRVEIAGLSVAEPLARFLEAEVFPSAGVARQDFWSGYAAILRDLGPRLKDAARRARRAAGQDRRLPRARRGQPLDQAHYLGFLREIGYLLPEAEAGTVSTANVDDEIARQAGPQLVVPMSNARYALNAANARWGSLYDALYGTDAIPHERGRRAGSGYNEARGALVIAKAKAFLDAAVPLAGASYTDLAGLAIVGRRSRPTLKDGRTVGLATPDAFVGHTGDAAAPEGRAAAPQRPRRRAGLRPLDPGRPHRPGGPRRRGARIRRLHHHGHGGLGRGRRRRRQGGPLPQLARPRGGHAVGLLPEGGQHRRAPHERRPHLHGAGRRAPSRCRAAR